MQSLLFSYCKKQNTQERINESFDSFARQTQDSPTDAAANSAPRSAGRPRTGPAMTLQQLQNQTEQFDTARAAFRSDELDRSLAPDVELPWVPRTPPSLASFVPPSSSSSSALSSLASASSPDGILQLEHEVLRQSGSDELSLLSKTPAKRAYVKRDAETKWAIAKHAREFYRTLSMTAAKFNVSTEVVRRLKAFVTEQENQVHAESPSVPVVRAQIRAHFEELNARTKKRCFDAWKLQSSPVTHSLSHLKWSRECEEEVVVRIVALRAAGAAVDLKLMRTLLIDAVRVREPDVFPSLTFSRPTMYALFEIHCCGCSPACSAVDAFFLPFLSFFFKEKMVNHFHFSFSFILFSFMFVNAALLMLLIYRCTPECGVSFFFLRSFFSFFCFTLCSLRFVGISLRLGTVCRSAV
jgi:hypothetical protein